MKIGDFVKLIPEAKEKYGPFHFSQKYFRIIGFHNKNRTTLESRYRAGGSRVTNVTNSDIELATENEVVWHILKNPHL